MGIHAVHLPEQSWAVGFKNMDTWDVNTLLRQKEEMMNKYAEFRALFLEKFATNQLQKSY